MLLSRVSSTLEKNRLIEIATNSGVLLLNPKKVASVQSLELAEHLANQSTKARTNISKKIHLEFLLWLAGRKDISSALEEMLFEDKEDILIVGMEKQGFEDAIKQIAEKKLTMNLPKESTPEELERISLSRIN